MHYNIHSTNSLTRGSIECYFLVWLCACLFFIADIQREINGFTNLDERQNAFQFVLLLVIHMHVPLVS